MTNRARGGSESRIQETQTGSKRVVAKAKREVFGWETWGQGMHIKTFLLYLRGVMLGDLHIMYIKNISTLLNFSSAM